MKKYVSILLSVLLLLTMLPLGMVSVSAETYGGLTYIIVDDQVTITGYTDDLPSELVIPDTIEGYLVTTVKEKALYNCAGLTSVTIPDSVTGIGHMAFYSCDNLSSVTIGDGVVNIGMYAFAMCSKLDSITIPDSVTTIGVGAFGSCDNLSSVTIGIGVTTIGERAFFDCDSLICITIPGNVTTIGEQAFNACDSLTSIEVDSDSLYYVSQDGVLFDKEKSIVIQCPPSGKSGAYIIPDSVTTIADYAFYECANLTEVVIPDSVTSIGDWAFNDCEGLSAIVIPHDVTTIGNCSFSSCSNLTSVVIPDGVTIIGDSAFSYCSKLTAITIPDSVVSIGSRAFYYCFGLTSIAIPDSVTSIGSRTFTHCSRLTSIEVDANNPYYASQDGVLFDKDINILLQYPAGKRGAYTIPDGVTVIGDYAFSECYPLTKAIIPDSVVTIGDGAFNLCGSLTEVNIGNGVSAIGDSAFSNCGILHTVTIGDSIVTIGDAAFGLCYSLSDVYYGGSEEDRKDIIIKSSNASFLNATWHYAKQSPLYSDIVEHSAMDTEQGAGLAFRFELTADGVATKNGTVADYINATVNYLGTDCKLVGMGAVITNDDEKGNILHMLRENVNGENMIDIPVVYLYDVGVSSCTFATRIINIPDTQLERVIYARPYYIVEVDGKQITVYGEIDSASCAEYM